MRIGYPCINRSVGCTASTTFRLASYSSVRLETCIRNNISCLRKILQFNAGNGLLFFRIPSGLVPFASHPICTYGWAGRFAKDFREIGRYIRENNMRISMHPDQFVLLNSTDEEVVLRSVSELKYHAKVLDLMRLGRDAKIQLHVGGVYGDKESALERFAERYARLPRQVRKRLVVENDGHLFSLSDCLKLHSLTGIPVLFDSFHHSLNNNGESMRNAILLAEATWAVQDGPLMCDYSSQQRGAKRGTHASTINLPDFAAFVSQAKGIELDIMLEIKDKEKSAIKAARLISEAKPGN
ncbi:MAG: UV DNA damage repair endonuclease UvsE [Candidatus Micrarchaeota archaeon]|nr:UV DNA damage repair endonuclease UvsE [Candidatus Micrarchaeota archaeon]